MLTSLPLNHHHWHPQGHCYNTQLRYSRQASTHVYKTALLLVEEGIYLFIDQSSLIQFSPFLSFLFAHKCAFLSSRQPSVKQLSMLSTDPSHLLTHTYTHTLSLPLLLFLDDTSTLAAPILDTLSNSISVPTQI